MRADLHNLQAPDALRQLPGWLVWRFEPNGDKKPRKMPYYVSGAKRHWTQGTAADRKNLTTFENAKAVALAKGFEGVGLALMPEFGVTALDFDDCVSDGVVNPEVEALTCGTYTEYSPSGNGIRAFVLGSLGTGKSLNTVRNPQPFGFEVFDCNGFVTFTGNATDLTELTGSVNYLAPITPALQAFRDARLNRVREQVEYQGSGEATLGLTDTELNKILAALPDDLPYDDWVHVGMALHHETEGEGFALWDEWSLASPKATTTEYNMERWASFGRNTTAAPYTCRSLLRFARDELKVDTGVSIDVAGVDEFEALDKPGERKGRFNIIHQSEFIQGDDDDVDWLIHNFLPKAQLGVLFGESGSGKSFATYDMCAAIGRGLATWNGHRITPGRVLYVVAEGKKGFKKRIKAYCHQHATQGSDIEVYVIADQTPNLMDAAHITDLIKEIKALGTFDLIVLDTFAQVMAGANENSGEDVGNALAQCKRINLHTGAMVLLVHHSGKDATKGARGWSGLKAAADVEIEVLRQGEARSITVTKLKDGEEGASYGFTLGTVVLGEDKHGDDVTSCVTLFNTSGRVKKQAAIKIGENEKLLLQLLEEANIKGDAEAVGVEKEALKNALFLELVDGTDDYKGQIFRRISKSLTEKGLIHTDDDGRIYKGAKNTDSNA